MATLQPPSFAPSIITSPATVANTPYARDDSVLYNNPQRGTSSTAPYPRRPSLPHNFQYTYRPEGSATSPPTEESLRLSHISPPQSIALQQPMMAQPFFYQTPPTPTSTSPLLNPYVPQRSGSPLLDASGHPGKYLVTSPALMPISPALTAIDPLALSPVVAPAVEPNVPDDSFSLNPSLDFGDGSSSGMLDSTTMDLDLDDLADVLNLDPTWDDGGGSASASGSVDSSSSGSKGIFGVGAASASPQMAAPSQTYYGAYSVSPTMNAGTPQMAAGVSPQLVHTSLAPGQSQLLMPYNPVPMQACTCADPHYYGSNACDDCKPLTHNSSLSGPVLGVSPTVVPHSGEGYAVDDGWTLDGGVATASGYNSLGRSSVKSADGTLAVPIQVPSIAVYPPDPRSRPASPLVSSMSTPGKPILAAVAPSMPYMNVGIPPGAAPAAYAGATVPLYHYSRPSSVEPSKESTDSPPSMASTASNASAEETVGRAKGKDSVSSSTSSEQKPDEAQRTFRCACGKGFPKLSSLKTHARLHGRERNFICDICKKGFLRKHDLTRHALTHLSNYKPFICPCGVTFTRQDAMMRHIKAGRCWKGRRGHYHGPGAYMEGGVMAAQQQPEQQGNVGGGGGVVMG
ncbi:hypothetical protein HDV00_008569 [Rhizophlyctis rosea]|nr:hypothetical protein HDV00_008569 [Rhizophlyctis rosea]